MNTFDIIIPVATKDVGFIPTVVEYVRRNIDGVDKIFAITNVSNIAKMRYLLKDKKIEIIDENHLIEGLTFSNVRKLLAMAGENRPSQTGWYFQQFLKFAFAQSSYARDYYLSWDADTLPINKIYFFLNEGKPLFTKKIEYHAPYFETLKRLIGVDRQVDYSFIAEHMLFNSNVVKDLISAISQSSVLGETWFEKIVNACDFSEGKANIFSEFETYGNFCAKYYTDMYEVRSLNTFRAAGLIRGRDINTHIIDRLAVDLHVASFEMQDAPFPHNIGWTIYRAKRKIISSVQAIWGG